jgi:CBS domain-containing membrane protein
MSWHHPRRVIDLLGLKAGRSSHGERIVSVLGGFFGIAGVIVVSHYFVGGAPAALVVASMGASAVLLFAVPHGPLSQPWSLTGGHLVSALIGVTCALWVPNEILAGALAVAVLFNYPFVRRRYPASLARRGMRGNAAQAAAPRPGFNRNELEQALRELDLHPFLPDTELEKIHVLANQQARAAREPPPDIRNGACYSNGAFGEQWSVRQVQGVHPGRRNQDTRVEYRVVAGKDRRRCSETTLDEFQRWARYEVIRNENTWQRLEDRPSTGAPAVLREKAS